MSRFVPLALLGLAAGCSNDPASPAHPIAARILRTFSGPPSIPGPDGPAAVVAEADPDDLDEVKRRQNEVRNNASDPGYPR